MNCPDPVTGIDDFQIDANGEIYYSCAANSGGYYHFLDSKGAKVSGSIDQFFGIGGVDTQGRFFTVAPGRLRDLVAGGFPIHDQHELVYDHTRFLQLEVVGAPECFNGSKIVAVRALDFGFIFVLQNVCGLQLWQTSDQTIMPIGYYAWQKIAQSDLMEEPGPGDVAADGSLYFYRICLSKSKCLTCEGMLCVMSPMDTSTADSVVHVAYPPLDTSATPVINKAQLVMPWFWRL
jgi:hypothetical protein